MKKGIDISKKRMEFLPHFGSGSNNGWLRIDINGMELSDASYIFINLDDLEELTRVPLNEVSEEIQKKWAVEKSPSTEDTFAEGIEYAEIGTVRLPKKGKKKD